MSKHPSQAPVHPAEGSSEGPRPRASDTPPDAVKEREDYVRNFLKKGVEYTELLIEENSDLREELSELREHNARLQSQIASDDVIRDLLRTVEKLERERAELLAKSDHLEASQRKNETEHKEIEQEVHDLANLYVASHQLHTSLSLTKVVRHLTDMIGQLVGARSFVIYIVEEDGKRALPIAHDMVAADRLVPVTVGAGPIGDTCLTGIPAIRDEDPTRAGSFDDPIAVIPLMAEGKPVGAISVISLLDQKSGWSSVDRELFELIGAQAGTALIAAKLYADVGNPLQALSGLRDQL